jgi:hypothetical protein
MSKMMQRFEAQRADVAVRLLVFAGTAVTLYVLWRGVYCVVFH